MSQPYSIEELHDLESLKDYTKRIREQEFSCKSLGRVFMLAKGVRRSARLGIDPEFTDALLEFDEGIEQACTELRKIIKGLIHIRERVDRAKIDAEREKRAVIFRRISKRKAALAAAKPIRYGANHRSITIEQAKKMLKGFTPNQMANLLAAIPKS